MLRLQFLPKIEELENMKVYIDQNLCVGAGQCVFAAPNVFDQRQDNGMVILLNAKPPEALKEAVAKAANLCPAAAIRLEEE
jgi:ferredoxin